MSPLVVAELSANHLGSIARARRLVNAAAEAGATHVKLQTWKPELMVGDESYRIRSGPWEGKLLKALYRDAATPWYWHDELFRQARELGLEPFSTAFDKPSVDFLESLGVARHKIASFELVDLGLIAYAASKGKPLILSTGMANDAEMVDARGAARGVDVTTLVCVSAYPAKPDGLLADIPASPWGLSDHTLGVGVAAAAVALGATYVEKHLTLSRADGGPDAGFSLEPAEFKAMATACREAYASVRGMRDATAEHPQRALRRSLWFAKDVPEGVPLRAGDVRSARPADGLPPKHLPELLGRVLARPARAGEPVSWDCFRS